MFGLTLQFVVNCAFEFADAAAEFATRCLGDGQGGLSLCFRTPHRLFGRFLKYSATEQQCRSGRNRDLEGVPFVQKIVIRAFSAISDASEEA
ncbi:MAG: hypothetical protein J4F42_16295 [Desulfurellaceae bacterium]|nr:hypothetical protein [Desulfurellaceae bacterium]